MPWPQVLWDPPEPWEAPQPQSCRPHHLRPHGSRLASWQGNAPAAAENTALPISV